VKVWDVETGDERDSWLGADSGVRSFALSRDGKYLATCSASEAMVQVWDTATHKSLHRWPVKEYYLQQVEFSPDGKWLAACTNRRQPYVAGEVLLWNLKTGALARQFEGHKRGVNTLRFLPDSRTLVSSGDDGTVRFWDLPTD
jgi:WD40 repeat protein